MCIRDRRTFDREHAADESRDLLLGGRASARDTLFDAWGGVFEYLQSAAQRRSHRHALRPAQLEHRLHVLAEEVDKQILIIARMNITNRVK